MSCSHAERENLLISALLLKLLLLLLCHTQYFHKIVLTHIDCITTSFEYFDAWNWWMFILCWVPCYCPVEADGTWTTWSVTQFLNQRKKKATFGLLEHFSKNFSCNYQAIQTHHMCGKSGKTLGKLLGSNIPGPIQYGIRTASKIAIVIQIDTFFSDRNISLNLIFSEQITL